MSFGGMSAFTEANNACALANQNPGNILNE